MVHCGATSQPIAGSSERQAGAPKGDVSSAPDTARRPGPVSMERQGAQTTKTEVSARKNIAVWDKDYAQELLGKIVKQK